MSYLCTRSEPLYSTRDCPKQAEHTRYADSLVVLSIECKLKQVEAVGPVLESGIGPEGSCHKRDGTGVPK